MIIAELPEAKTYAPVGRCIYCGDATDTAESPLHDERVLALGLNGKLVLPKASCGKCKEHTRAIERASLNEILVFPHAHLSLRTPRPAHARSGKLLAGSMQWTQLDRGEHPEVFFLPRFARPGIFAGLEFTEKFTLQQPVAETFIGERIFNPARAAQFMQSFNAAPFCIMLATIAQRAAVAELGMEAFEPWLPKLISGEWPYLSHYIGATRSKLENRGSLHQIWLRSQFGYLIATVRLFARHGFHGYDVVIGKALQLPGNVSSRWTYTEPGGVS